MIKLDQLKTGSILVSKNEAAAKCRVLGVCGEAIFLAHGKVSTTSYFMIEEINILYTLEGPRLPKKGDVIVITIAGGETIRVATGSQDREGRVLYYNAGHIEGTFNAASFWGFYEPEKLRGL